MAFSTGSPFQLPFPFQNRQKPRELPVGLDSPGANMAAYYEALKKRLVAKTHVSFEKNRIRSRCHFIPQKFFERVEIEWQGMAGRCTAVS
jgi:hypothetical protein